MRGIKGGYILKKIMLFISFVIFMLNSSALAAQMPPQGDFARIAASVRFCGSMNGLLIAGLIVIAILAVICVIYYKEVSDEKTRKH